MPPTYAALATPLGGGDRSLFVWAPGDVPRALGLPMGSSTAAFADRVPTEHIGSWFRFGDVLFAPSAGTGGVLRGFPVPSGSFGTQRAADLALLGSSIHFVAPSTAPTGVDLGRMDCPGPEMSETCSENGMRTTHQLTPDGGAVSVYYPSLEAIGDNVLALTYVTAGFLPDGSPSPMQGVVRFFRANHEAIPASEPSPGVTLFSGHDLPTSTIHTSIATASSRATGRVTTLLVSALWSYNSPVADRVWTTGLRICERQ